MRLGLGQPHLVDQPGFASQTYKQVVYFTLSGIGNCEGIGIASP